MAALINQEVDNTIGGLIIFPNNTGVTGSLQTLTDGAGVNTALRLSNAAATVNGTLTATTVNATTGNLTNIGCTNGIINNLTTNTGTVTTLTSTQATIGNVDYTTQTGTTQNATTVNATTGNIVNIGCTNATINNLTTSAGTITTLGSTTGNITTVNSTTGNITTLSSTTVNSTNANITTISSTTTTAGTLRANGSLLVRNSGGTLATELTNQNASGTISLGLPATVGSRGQSIITDGTGSLSFTGLSIAQRVSTLTGATASGTTTTPLDDTIPQLTEGTLFLSQAITPKHASNILVIDFYGHFSLSTSPLTFTTFLCQDSTANALAAVGTGELGTGVMMPVKLTYIMTAGTTSATTFKILAGAQSAATVYFNGNSGGRLFGGIMNSYIQITEYTA